MAARNEGDLLGGPADDADDLSGSVPAESADGGDTLEVVVGPIDAVTLVELNGLATG